MLRQSLINNAQLNPPATRNISMPSTSVSCFAARIHCSRGPFERPGSPIRYPRGRPGCHLIVLCSDRTLPLAKVCSSLQPQLHSQVTPICTARPRLQSEGKFPCGINRNGIVKWKGKTRVDCVGERAISIHSYSIVLFFSPIGPPRSST